MTNRAYGLLFVMVVLGVVAALGNSCGVGADPGSAPPDRPTSWRSGPCRYTFLDAAGKPRTFTDPSCMTETDLAANDVDVVDAPDGGSGWFESDSVSACIKKYCRGLTGKTRAACNHQCQGK